MKKKTPFITLSIIAGLILIAGATTWVALQFLASPAPENFVTTEHTAPETPSTDIDLACIGDILIHNTVYMAAQTSAGYDFRSQFIHVKPLLEKADLTIANMEGTLAGPEQKYSGYPQFNCPDAIVDTLKDAGVDVLTAANNHSMDKGRSGFLRTIDTIRAQGLDVIGTRKNEQESPYVIKNVKGVKVGVINFGYGTNTGTDVQINGIPLPKDMEPLLNFIDYNRLDEELAKLRNTIAAARNSGADVLVVCMHWGNEYQTHSDSLQQKTAQELADLNVDIVFGGHPHVLQEADYVVSQTQNNHKTLVYYSLGNFISDQRLETVSNINTEHGMIAQVTLRHYADGRNEILSSGYTATWVNKKKTTKTLYEVIPVSQALDNISNFPHLVSADRSRLQTCQKSVDEQMKKIAP